MKNLKAMVKDANKEISQVIEFLQSRELQFKNMNLKLYDIIWECDKIQKECNISEDEFNNYFQEFCDCEFNLFLDYLEIEKIDRDIMHYIGRTSTFYLTDDRQIISIYQNELDLENTISEYIYNCVNGSSDLASFGLADNGLVDYEKIKDSIKKSNKEWTEYTINEIKSDLQTITSDIYNDFYDMVQDIDKVYNYIKEFKDNQVNNFIDFIKMCQE